MFDVAPSGTGYTATATPTDGKLAIHVAPGGALMPTQQGTLAFTIAVSGAVIAR